MEKPLLIFRRFGHQVHLMMKTEAKRSGFEFIGGPQGQVLRYLNHQEEMGQTSKVGDIEKELNISKSVASNLVKRMIQNGLVTIEVCEKDKRAKFVSLTDQSRAQMKQVQEFFDQLDQNLVEGISPQDLQTFERVLAQFQENIEKIGERSHEETR
ncbi:MarR family winged helix-turn-helix transcriptional regulator [Streptococcus oralis]|uniref:Transcriptional regulator, MarR family n=1 Tax=Streptococcus oralis TaxID=1303 RepID=A0A139PFS7_STROR|nr:MarR family winged helix-turn-helix transcriptional regulator [Streptococcus oralis]KXT80354.1 Transcriptional regulator, MarR family [Streptococcus oralis]KXT82235.1 Transcriptional regulator, MarR family [Streptococcus oralis]KXT88082.1 Transcriptional regulator, MarR family [Streptococcus oralis]